MICKVNVALPIKTEMKHLREKDKNTYNEAYCLNFSQDWDTPMTHEPTKQTILPVNPWAVVDIFGIFCKEIRVINSLFCIHEIISMYVSNLKLLEILPNVHIFLNTMDF